jgi:hypothetical protein
MTVVVADANRAPLRAEFEAALPAGTEVRLPSPPHSSGLTPQTFDGRAANIRRLDAGEPLRNVVAVAR